MRNHHGIVPRYTWDPGGPDARLLPKLHEKLWFWFSELLHCQPFTACFSNAVPIYGQCSKRVEEAERANGGQMEKDGMRKTGRKRQRKTNTEAVRNEENEGEAEWRQRGVEDKVWEATEKGGSRLCGGVGQFSSSYPYQNLAAVQKSTHKCVCLRLY